MSVNIFQKAWTWCLGHDVGRKHWRRYVLGCVVSALGFASVSAMYLHVAPTRYTSEWSVILPGAGVNAKVALDRIGQTQTSATSPFSNKGLNPKVNYKEIASSRVVLRDAARRAQMSVEGFGRPQIKLIDQTSIIEFRQTSNSPRQAQIQSIALLQALRGKLDQLRSEEIARRQKSSRETIGTLEKTVKLARRKLLDLQVDSGLSSIAQFEQLVASIEDFRGDEAKARMAFAERKSQVATISTELGVAPERAMKVLSLVSDHEFRQIWQAYTAASVTYAENATRFGSSHPRVTDPRAKMNSIERALTLLLTTRNIALEDVRQMRLFGTANDKFVELLTELAMKHAEQHGQAAMIDEITRQLSVLEERRRTLGVIAAKLDDLERDHKIANAVFSSAVARIDVASSDIYASYPLLQVLEAPSLPTKPSSPKFIFALLACIAGTLISCVGWGFAWVRQWFTGPRLQSQFVNDFFDRRTQLIDADSVVIAAP